LYKLEKGDDEMKINQKPPPVQKCAKFYSTLYLPLLCNVFRPKTLYGVWFGVLCNRYNIIFDFKTTEVPEVRVKTVNIGEQ